MVENTTMSDQPTSESEPLAARIRALLKQYNPVYLGPLGLLSLPAEFVDSLEFLELFGVFWLFFPWIFVGPLVDLALRTQIEEESQPTDWIEAGGAGSMIVAIATMPLAFLNPVVLFQDLTQFVGGGLAALRHGGSLPDAESYEQAVEYRLPFDGEWTVVNGSPEREYSHSWIYPTQRYAYDFLITDESGRSRPEGAGNDVDDYYCYDEPVLAPADGVVVEAVDSALESRRAGGFSHPASRDIRGGYVVVRHAPEEYSLLAHLKPGSVPVEVGDRVERGQTVGRCGHSGNSSEPHLHFQVQDHPEFVVSASLPVQFSDVSVEQPGVPHDTDLVPGAGIGDGVHERTWVVAGQRVSHVEDGVDDDVSQPPRAVDATTAQAVEHSPTRTPLGVFPVTRALGDAAVGLGVAGILLFAARFVVSGPALVGVLAAAGAVGFLFGLGHRLFGRGEFNRRSVATPLGLVAGASLLAALTGLGVGSGVVVGVLFLGGLLATFAFAELGRAGLSRALPTGTPA